MDKLTKTETPAMLEGLADHQWNWEEFFNFNLTIKEENGLKIKSK